MQVSLVSRLPLRCGAVVCLAVMFILGGRVGTPESHAAVTCSHRTAPYCWPTSVSANGRYLLDQTRRPYLIVGDSPQSLIGELSERQAKAYFANRHAHGINSVWIDLICAQYTGCSGDGSTYDGIKPFNGTSSDPFANPNPAYFNRAADMIKFAAARGITVFLDPAETGGWLSSIDQAGAKNDYRYGVFVGTRFKHFRNIIWISGNDFQSWQSAADNANVLAIATGIRSVEPQHFQTIELNYHASSTLNDRSWAS